MGNDKKILVVGLGYRTGLASANFLAEKGFDVTVCDSKSHEELLPVIQLLNPAVRVSAGNQDPSLLSANFHEIIISPGVPPTIPLIQTAKNIGVPIVSEIELGYRYSKSAIVGITGTDGKSTTTMLTAHCMRAVGFDAHHCGNIGIPYVSIVEKLDKESVAVIELSSFQLEAVHTFKADVSMFINLSLDHMDRYNSMLEYFNAKMNITKNQTGNDYFIVNKDDEYISAHLPRLLPVKKEFSLQEGADCYYKNGAIYCTVNDEQRMIAKTNRFKIIGLHNVQNAMAAVLATVLLAKKTGRHIDIKGLEEALYSYEGLPHRIQTVGTYAGRTFINDSKATTVAAVIMAVKSMTGNTILILGGREKGDDYSRLKHYFGTAIKALVLIGETKDTFAEIFSDTPHVKAHSMEDALVKAMKMSAEGDAILLSPACASFDMYKNYEERGSHFTEIVGRLSRGEMQWM